MNFNRIALEQDLAENYSEGRFETEWKDEKPISEPTNLGLTDLKSKTQLYADFIRDNNLREDKIMRASTYHKSTLDELMQDAKGIRIYMVAEEKNDENNEPYLDIFPILVPVNDNFVDKLNFEPGSVNFITDVASKCPPPVGECHPTTHILLN